MNLSNNLAQDITEEIKSIINQDINYFDERAYIIASTNKERIGDFHQGAKKVLDSKKELIIDYDGQYKGAKKGINLPVYFLDDIVGVIGITGSMEEVGHYGKIIQKMTELLIKDAYIQEKRLSEKENRREFIEELLFKQEIDKDSLYMWADLLDFKIEHKLVVIVASIYNREISIPGSHMYDKILKLIEDYFSYNKRNIVIKSGENIIIVGHFKNLSLAEESICKLDTLVKNKFKDLRLIFGLGDAVKDIKDLQSSYYQAYKTLSIARHLNNKNVCRYDNLDIGLIIDSIPKDVSTVFLEKIFADMSEEDIIKYCENFLKYIEHNGSINKAAQDLFIHKNTLQYRLDSLYERTSYNPRNLGDMLILYLAFSLYKYNLD